MTSFEFQPPIPVSTLVLCVVALAAAYGISRWLFGKAESVSRRPVLTLMRCAVLVVLTMLFLNPVRVTEVLGKVDRSEMFYVLDSSASMQMGSGSNRWSDSLKLIDEARDSTADDVGASIRMFRFGQRLSAVKSEHQRLAQEAVPQKATPETQDSPATKAAVNPMVSLDQIQPVDSDSRLLQALRQLPSRFGRKRPAGVVLFTDGRVRDPQAVREAAASFKELGVPVHVAPQGNMSGGGDVAIVGVVAPRRVRKFTEVEVHVFLRSYGYDSRSIDLSVTTPNEDGTSRVLKSMPVILQSGFQSSTLTFQTDSKTRNLKIEVAGLPDEVATNNNTFETEIDIDRTKIRVLYVEGSRSPQRVVIEGGVRTIVGPYTDFQRALLEDPDIECSVVTAGSGILTRAYESGASTGSRGFPATKAELSAFDAIVLSDVPSTLFEEEQLKWIHECVAERGAGLLMAGGEFSFSGGEWNKTSIARLLPVTFSSEGNDWNSAATVAVSVPPDETNHALWHLREDEQQRLTAITSFPELQGANASLRLKPDVGIMLASSSSVALPARPPSALGALLGFGNTPAKVSESSPTGSTTANELLPLLTAAHTGKGRSIAFATSMTAPGAAPMISEWGGEKNGLYGRFWRNAIYWLTESSSVGRRRLLVTADKRYYSPEEKLHLRASTFDEHSAETQAYRVVAMLEPQQLSNDESLYSPLRWPGNMVRESGEEGPLIAWGEEFELPKSANSSIGGTGGYEIELDLADALESGTASQALRFELTAYEDFTQVDSSSLDIQILHDPFEQQNPFPDHDLLADVAQAAGGKVIASSKELASLIGGLPTTQGDSEFRRQPAWSRWWFMVTLLGLLTVEWFLRRSMGLA